MAHRAMQAGGGSIADRPRRARIARADIERSLGRATLAGVVIALVIGLDAILPAPEHVDARWLGLLLAAMGSAYAFGLVMGLAVAAVGLGALLVSLFEPTGAGPVPAQDLVALAFFIAASVAGAVAIARLRPVDPPRPAGATHDPDDPDPLTAREITILGLLERGLSNEEIADVLVVSPNTVKTHLEHLYGKLAVGSRGRAVAEGRRRGLIA